MTLPSTVAALAVLALVAASGCRTTPGGSSDDPGSGASTSPAGARDQRTAHPRFVPAPPGDVPAIVQKEVARARSEGRRLVVYEGASWCEPCQHFHAAVAQGDLDAAFPSLTLLEFDADRDRDRLIAAGYGSPYIPLFALPGKDGRAAGPKAAGGIKGDGVVPYLTKKLDELLSQGS